MKTYLSAALLALAAALTMTATAADEPALTRDQVRAELAEARAAGLLDVPGDTGATEAVLAARDQYNALLALVLQARWALQEQLLSAVGEVTDPDLEVYYEAGPHGPVMVLLIYDEVGDLYSADTVALATLD